jgi:repressor of nif and glnA expression
MLITAKQNPSTLDIQAFIKEKYQKKISEKLIRYHLNRMIESGLIVRKKARYFVNNHPYAEPNALHESFNHWIKQPVNNSMNDIEQVLVKMSEAYKK